MIGRQANLANALSLIEAVKQGNPGMLFIDGPAGIGKTTFINHLLTRFSDSLCIKTRIIESSAFPYGPIKTAGRKIIQEDPRITRQLNLSKHLALLVPEIISGSVQSDQDSLFAAVQELFWKAAGDRLLVFVIEDLHWADTATLELIPHLFEGIPRVSFLLLGTYRTGEMSTDHKLMWLRSDLRRSDRYQEISLGPLADKEISEMIKDMLEAEPDKKMVSFVSEKTGGNPLFISELVKELEDKSLLAEQGGKIELQYQGKVPIPDSIRDMVILRMDSLSQAARQTLRFAACLGVEFELHMLRELTGDHLAIDALFEADLIHESAAGKDKAAFKHALIQEAVREGIPWSKRKGIYYKIAELLHQKNANAELIGDFYLKADAKTEAVEALKRAAREYCSIFAFKDGVRLSKKTLDNWPENEEESERLSFLKEYAHCARLSGQIHESLLALRELAENTTLQEKHQELAEIYRDLAVCYALQGTWSSYKTARRQAAVHFEDSQSWEEAAKEWCASANQHIDELDISAALKAIDKAVEAAGRGNDSGIKARALSIKGYALAIRGNTREGQEMAREAISIALKDNQIEATAYAYRKLAGTYEYASDFDESLRTYDSALNFCSREELNVQALFCLSCMSWVLFRLGNWKRGLEVCNDVLTDPVTNDPSRATAHVVTGLIRIYRGETKEAKTHIDQARILADKENFKLIALIIDWATAAYFEQNGDAREAARYYDDLINHWEELHDLHDVLPGFMAAITFYADQDKSRDLTRCIKALSTICDTTGNAEALASLAYGLGRSSLKGNAFEEAEFQFRQSIDSFRETGVTLQLLLARKGLAEALIGQFRDGEAAEELRGALKTAKNMGLRPMAGELAKILNELKATETEPRDETHPARQHRAGLTRRQLEVMQEMAKGLSNKEIATALHLSTRTVDMHVSNILNRLNCRSRTEAVKIAVEENLVE